MTKSQDPNKLISSTSNTLFKLWHDLLKTKGIKKHGQFLVFGERAVFEMLELHPRFARNLLLDESLHSKLDTSDGQAAQKAAQKTVQFAQEQMKSDGRSESMIVYLASALFKELDVFGTRSPILVMMAPEIPKIDLTDKPQGLEIVCALQDPANLGALIRSAAAFGVSQVILLKECASPLHPRAIRAASATSLSVRLVHGPSIQDLASIARQSRQAHGSTDFAWVALDMLGSPINKFNWQKNVRLILGEEGQGVPESSDFEFVAIPMANGVESLNATVAASIALYAYRSSYTTTT
jgi:TrmH family RNA methyltransferase